MAQRNPVVAAAVAAVRQQWFRLLMTGLVITAAGVVAIVSPMIFRVFLLDTLGLLLLGTAAALAVQWFVGRQREAQHAAGGITFFVRVVLLAIGGILLIQAEWLAIRLLALLFGLLLIADGLVELLIAWPVATFRMRLLLLASAGANCLVGALTLFYSGSPAVGEWLAFLVGIKLLVFGMTLVAAGWFSRRQVGTDQAAFVYGLRRERPVDKVAGELYAVFIGNAFHLGVYVGNNQVVDYRDDNQVYLVTWEQFLLGRDPQHWEYPDVAAAPAAEVIRTARNAVGKSFPYRFFEFNCEHFAIWCKTGGKTSRSNYTQVALAMSSIKQRPIIGPVLQLHARIAEWMAFHLGGTFGKQAAFAVRRFSSLITTWLLAGYLQSGGKEIRPINEATLVAAEPVAPGSRPRGGARASRKRR